MYVVSITPTIPAGDQTSFNAWLKINHSPYQYILHDAVGVAIGFAVQPSAADEQDMRDTYAGAFLDEYRATKKLAIDVKTQSLIAAGYSYGGKKLSLSENSQTYVTGMATAIGAGLMTNADFPVDVNTLDDLDIYTVTDTADALSLYGVVVGTIKGHLESGTVLKELVRAAVDRDAVDAINDTR